MSGVTFSRAVKADLAAARPRRLCCRRALLCGLETRPTRDAAPYSASLADKLKINPGSLNEPEFVCEGCVAAYIQGVFISCGTVNKPGGGYHLELDPADDGMADRLLMILKDSGIEPHVSRRAGKKYIYYKDSERIEDFLNFIGAQKAAFALMNTKIERDIRNTANRRTNCDAANIGRTVSAAARQIEAIERLAAAGELKNLPPELRETADLRLRRPDASLDELAALHSPSVSRSGVHHRLERIINIEQSLS